MSTVKDSDTSKDEIEAVLGVGKGAGTGILKRAKWPVLAILALLLVGATLYNVMWGGSTTNGLQYKTDPVTLGDITVVVTATGTVEPTNKVDISSELSGIVRSVSVDYNDTVKSGQNLADLDTDKLRAAVESSRARLNAAQAMISEASATVVEKRHEHERKRALSERRMVSMQELESARATYNRALASRARARADAKAAQADLKLNETNLEKACICSPINGVVLSRNVEPGQVVASALQAPVLFTIAEDLRKMEVRVDVDEADVGKVREGQTATFTVDAYPARQFEAQIKALHFGSEMVQGVVTYKAILATDNADLLLRPGMTATAEIMVQQQSNVVTVSNEALRFTPPVADNADSGGGFLKKLLPGFPNFRPASSRESNGPEREIWVLKDNQSTVVPVTVGVTDGRRTQVVVGQLEVGQKTIVDALTSSK